jgi:hypothetical protein
MAAFARGDEREWSRLAAAAPRVQVPHHYSLAQALCEVADRHFMQLLNLAALYFMGQADARDEEERMRALDAVLLLGYWFNVNLAGWRQFCREHGFDPETLWSDLPGLDMLTRAEKVAERAAFVPEGAVCYLRRCGHENVKAITADDVAAGLGAYLKARADWWG